MRVTVFGASGDQGAAQVRRLRAAGHHPVAVGRSLSKLHAVVGHDVECVVADYSDRAAIDSALRGADAVFLTLPSTSFQAADGVIQAATEVADAAMHAGVGIIVFNSSMAIMDRPMGFAAQDARFEIRRRLFASGVPAVSIQPVIYIDNLLRAWAKPHINRGVICYPHAETLDVSWISQDDSADLMIAAMTRPHLAGRAFNVGGAEAIRGPDLARRLSAVLERPLRFVSQPIPDFTASMNSVFEKVSTLDRDRLRSELERIYTWYNHGAERPFLVDMAPVLAELPVRLTRLEDWAAAQTWS